MKKASLFILLLIWACNTPESRKTDESSIPTNVAGKQDESETVILMEEQLADRTEWQNPQLILDQLGDLSQQTVADIGAGSGYFSFKLAKVAKKVIALDINPKALEYIDEQKDVLGPWTDVIETRLTDRDKPELGKNEVDVVLVVNTFAYIPEQENYFIQLKENVKPNGTVVIVDFKQGDIPVGPSEADKIDPSEVRKILRKAGFRKIKIDRGSLAYQYIISATN